MFFYLSLGPIPSPQELKDTYGLFSSLTFQSNVKRLLSPLYWICFFILNLLKPFKFETDFKQM